MEAVHNLQQKKIILHIFPRLFDMNSNIKHTIIRLKQKIATVLIHSNFRMKKQKRSYKIINLHKSL